MSDLYPKIQKYYDELVHDTKLTDLTMHEKSLSLPGIKAKWVMYLYRERKYHDELEKILNSKQVDYMNKIKQTNNLLIKPTLVSESDLIVLKDNIKESKETILFLQDVCKTIIQNFNFDVKNVVDLIKVEAQ